MTTSATGINIPMSRPIPVSISVYTKAFCVFCAHSYIAEKSIVNDIENNFYAKYNIIPPMHPRIVQYGVRRSSLAVAPTFWRIEKQLPAITVGDWQQAAKEPAATPPTVKPNINKIKNKAKGIKVPTIAPAAT